MKFRHLQFLLITIEYFLYFTLGFFVEHIFFFVFSDTIIFCILQHSALQDPFSLQVIFFHLSPSRSVVSASFNKCTFRVLAVVFPCLIRVSSYHSHTYINTENIQHCSILIRNATLSSSFEKKFFIRHSLPTRFLRGFHI